MKRKFKQLWSIATILPISTIQTMYEVSISPLLTLLDGVSVCV